jgi:type II secretory pathway component PulF
MIWILLLYVLPLIVSVAGAYYFVKQDIDGSVKDFIKVIPFLFIPLANILFVIGGIVIMILEWLENDENWQNFLNKKL